MDPRIWSRLPEDLLEHVLSFLPLNTFLNFRSTCKHFKSLIYSPAFISKHSSSSPSSSSNPSSFLLLSHPQILESYSLYDTTLNTWRNLSLPLPPSLSCAPSSSLLSISSGLICFSLPNASSFLVCNLLAGTSRTVNFPKYPFPFSFDSLTLVSTSTGFKLFVLRSSSGSSTNAFVYDSGLDLWVHLNQIDSVLGDNHNYHRHAVVNCNGFLYFTTQDPLSIVGFCLETGKWERLVVNLRAEDQLSFVRLVSDGSRKLFLIGGIGQYGISRRVNIWEREREGEDWVEIGSVPETTCRKFMSVCYHNYEHVNGFWHQGLICICCYTWPEILYLDVSRRSWHWLPRSPSLPEKWSCGFRWFSLVPQLHAFV